MEIFLCHLHLALRADVQINQTKAVRKMNTNNKNKTTFLIAVFLILLPASMNAQPVFSELPNPNQEADRLWADAPPGGEWGSVTGVEVDADGEHIWVAERCRGANCLGIDVDPVMKYNRDGHLVQSFGGGIFARPHGIHLDQEGNIWVSDSPSNLRLENQPHPDDASRGHQVVKFSPEGEVLMVLGEPGKAGNPPDRLTYPNDILVAPNGDIYIAEGHDPESPVHRISRFSSDGTYLGGWGSPGSEPGQFLYPHALAIDSENRLFVADRSNARVQIFDLEGNFIDSWSQFGQPSDVSINARDELLTVDYQSGGELNPDYRRGVYIGSAADGQVKAFIPAQASNSDPLGVTGEGVSVDAEGNVYVGEVILGGVTRYPLESSD
jgi:DNA-binding beta-propeller fold protein YncE